MRNFLRRVPLDTLAAFCWGGILASQQAAHHSSDSALWAAFGLVVTLAFLFAGLTLIAGTIVQWRRPKAKPTPKPTPSRFTVIGADPNDPAWQRLVADTISRHHQPRRASGAPLMAGSKLVQGALFGYPKSAADRLLPDILTELRALREEVAALRAAVAPPIVVIKPTPPTLTSEQRAALGAETMRRLTEQPATYVQPPIHFQEDATDG